ncbi:hypothetical protein BDR07DRAFT_472666 [Suillus spraguei]|nr:hypothetical protein BDR07DRAFT_472666 [Suillus spraguei]
MLGSRLNIPRARGHLPLAIASTCTCCISISETSLILNISAAPTHRSFSCCVRMQITSLHCNRLPCALFDARLYSGYFSYTYGGRLGPRATDLKGFQLRRPGISTPSSHKYRCPLNCYAKRQ